MGETRTSGSVGGADATTPTQAAMNACGSRSFASAPTRPASALSISGGTMRGSASLRSLMSRAATPRARRDREQRDPK